MGTVESMKPKTLVDPDVSLSSQPATESQALTSGSSDALAGPGTGPDGSAGGVGENGARVWVSVSDSEGLKGSVVTSSDMEGGFLGDDAKVTMGSSSSENEKQDVVEHGGRSETANDLDSALGTENNHPEGGFLGDDAKVTIGLSSSENGKQDVVEHGGRGETATDLDSALGTANNREMGSEKKVGFDGDGISLLVGVDGSLGNVAGEKKCGNEDDKASLAENAEDPDQKMTVRKVSVTRMRSMRGIAEEKGELKGKSNNGEDIDGDREDLNEDNREDEDEDVDVGEDMGEQDHEYFVGDYVWGKIRSHPWWPGQIYDPSDASECAKKFKQKNRLLVAYFGDASFSWCSPSQLKPFAENFEEMSKQSSSKNFVIAVERGLDEIGRILELKMNCSCVQKANQLGFIRPLALNGGIKPGVHVPEQGVGKISFTWNEPEKLLDLLRYIAQMVSITNSLELTMLNRWLSAFYGAKGGYKLAVYQSPLNVEGLEDKNRNGVMDIITDFTSPVEVLVQGQSEEDWLNQKSQSILQKCPGITEDKLYQRRKRKSVAEIMEEDTTVEPKNKGGSNVKELTRSGNSESQSGKKKWKRVDKAETQAGGNLISPARGKRGRKKKGEIFESAESVENKVSRTENGCSEGKEETSNGSVSTKGKKKRESSVENDDETKEETEMVSALRDRKKSKYLSPPYTSLNRKERDSSSKKVSETESVKIAKVARMGERMSRVAVELIGSPPIMKCSETFQKEKFSGEPNTEHDQTRKEDKKSNFKVNAPAAEVLSEVRSAALNPLYLRESKSVSMMLGFVCTFRSSIYLYGSSYKIYHKLGAGKKRESIITDHKAPKSKSPKKGNEKTQPAKSDMRKRKEANGKSMKKLKDEGANGTDDSSVSLILTFPPGFSLPSRDDLINIYRKFGALNEIETNVFYSSSCARVVFVSGSDAEQAFNISVKNSPFGAANVNYRLRYPSSASKAGDVDGKFSSPRKEGIKMQENPSASQLDSVDESSKLVSIRQKLEMLTAMVEKSDGKMLPEMKAKLEDEMKGLLGMVSAMCEYA